MTILPITSVGDPVLRERASELDLDELRSPEVQQLIDDLIETRRAAGGAGLAANQISVPKRIAVVEVDDATRTRYPYKPPVALTVIVNPELEPLSDEKLLINEGCLSVPGLRGDVERLVRIRVRFFDRNGEERSLAVDGLTAGTFQHEVDHLDGVLFLDRVSDPRSFSTWEQFQRHGQEAFLRRVARYLPEGEADEEPAA
jgi:peptide deformylase